MGKLDASLGLFEQPPYAEVYQTSDGKQHIKGMYYVTCFASLYESADVNLSYVNIPEKSSGEDTGNGTYDGTHGRIQQGWADFSMYYMETHKLNPPGHLTPTMVSTSYSIFSVDFYSSEPNLGWWTQMLALGFQTSLMLLVTLAILAFFIKTLEKKISLMSLLSLLLCQDFRPFDKLWLLMVLYIVTITQAFFNVSYSTEVAIHKRSPPIDNLQDLMESGRQPTWIEGDRIIEDFSQSTSKTHDAIWKRRDPSSTLPMDATILDAGDVIVSSNKAFMCPLIYKEAIKKLPCRSDRLRRQNEDGQISGHQSKPFSQHHWSVLVSNRSSVNTHKYFDEIAKRTFEHKLIDLCFINILEGVLPFRPQLECSENVFKKPTPENRPKAMTIRVLPFLAYTSIMLLSLILFLFVERGNYISNGGQK